MNCLLQESDGHMRHLSILSFAMRPLRVVTPISTRNPYHNTITTAARPKHRLVNDTADLLAAPVYTAAQVPVPVPLAFPPVAPTAVPFQDPCPIADEVAATLTALLAGHAPAVELVFAVGRTDTVRAGIVEDVDAGTEDQGPFDVVLDFAG